MAQVSADARKHMQALTEGLPTKTAKIRALSATGYKRQKIADFLGIRYQHVHNVLMQAPAQRAETTASLKADAVISAVNVAEVGARLLREGVPALAMRQALLALDLEVVAFDEAVALDSAELRQATVDGGLSLRDRACLALARSRGAVAVAADRMWTRIPLGVDIRLIR